MRTVLFMRPLSAALTAMTAAGFLGLASSGSAGTSALPPYKPTLNIFSGDIVPRGQVRFSIHSEFRAPATAEVDLWVPAAYTPDLTQTVGTQIGGISGSIDDRGLTAPYNNGTITVADPTVRNQACDPSGRDAFWLATLKSSTNSFSFPIYVSHPGDHQPTELHWCLPRNAPQFNTLSFNLNGVFTEPLRGKPLWDGRFTPYSTTGIDGAHQIFGLAVVRLPQQVTLRASYSNHRYTLTGRVTEADIPARAHVAIWRSVGPSPFTTVFGSPEKTLVTSDKHGRFTFTGRLSTSQTVRFKAQAQVAHKISSGSCGTDTNGVPCGNYTIAPRGQDLEHRLGSTVRRQADRTPSLGSRLRAHSASLAQGAVLPSERNDGSDCWLYECLGKRASELVDGFPAGAVSRQETVDVGRGECVNCGLDDRLEDPAGEVKAADEASDALLAREPLCVAQDVDSPRMRAAGDDDETLAPHVDDQVLVVPDHRVGFPTSLCLCVVDWEAPLECREPLDLT